MENGPIFTGCPGLPVLEVVVRVHALLQRQPVGGGHPVGGGGRAVHQHPLPVPAVGIPADGHVHAAQIHAVVRVQVGDEDRVQVLDVHVALQHAQRPGAQVQQDLPVACPVERRDQIAGGGRSRAGEGAGAANDRQLHEALAFERAAICGVIIAMEPVG